MRETRSKAVRDNFRAWLDAEQQRHPAGKKPFPRRYPGGGWGGGGVASETGNLWYLQFFGRADTQI